VSHSYLGLGIGFLAFAGCLFIPDGPPIKGSGVKITEARPIREFHELFGTGVGNYKVTSGQPPALKISTDDNLIPYVQATLDPHGEQLHIGMKSGNYDWTITPEFEIATKDLKSIKLQGKIALGATQINASKFTVHTEGQTSVVLTGTVDELTVRMDGQSSLQAGDLKCKKVKIICNGMCTAVVHASQAIEADANGMCTVDVLGKPGVKDFRTAGMSKINEK